MFLVSAVWVCELPASKLPVLSLAHHTQYRHHYNLSSHPSLPPHATLGHTNSYSIPGSCTVHSHRHFSHLYLSFLRPTPVFSNLKASPESYCCGEAGKTLVKADTIADVARERRRRVPPLVSTTCQESSLVGESSVWEVSGRFSLDGCRPPNSEIEQDWIELERSFRQICENVRWQMSPAKRGRVCSSARSATTGSRGE
jgi:hypothetical protein